MRESEHTQDVTLDAIDHGVGKARERKTAPRPFAVRAQRGMPLPQSNRRFDCKLKLTRDEGARFPRVLSAGFLDFGAGRRVVNNDHLLRAAAIAAAARHHLFVRHPIDPSGFHLVEAPVDFSIPSGGHAARVVDRERRQLAQQRIHQAQTLPRTEFARVQHNFFEHRRHAPLQAT